MTKLKDALREAMLERPVVLCNWTCPSPLRKNSLFSTNDSSSSLQQTYTKEDLGIESIPMLGLLSVR